MKDIHDIIKHAKFGDDRLRGSGVVADQISAFPIDFAGRPYNTLTLPCERVITACNEPVACDSFRITIGLTVISASEATATWRFTNFVLYCIIVLGFIFRLPDLGFVFYNVC